MYLESLKIFCDVVRLRSFSRAAAANRITQSAASQNVLQLEKGLGVRLLDRSKRPFQLTPEGRVYFDGCKGLIERYYAVEAEVKTLSQEVAGTARVAAIYSVGLTDMSQLVQEFAQTHPRRGGHRPGLVSQGGTRPDPDAVAGRDHGRGLLG
jgi:DNA-binding transcriptional LysR family regulator